MGKNGKKWGKNKKKGREMKKRVKNARQIPQNWEKKKISPDRGWEKK